MVALNDSKALCRARFLVSKKSARHAKRKSNPAQTALGRLTTDIELLYYLSLNPEGHSRMRIIRENKPGNSMGPTRADIAP